MIKKMEDKIIEETVREVGEKELLYVDVSQLKENRLLMKTLKTALRKQIQEIKRMVIDVKGDDVEEELKWKVLLELLEEREVSNR